MVPVVIVPIPAIRPCAFRTFRLVLTFDGSETCWRTFGHVPLATVRRNVPEALAALGAGWYWAVKRILYALLLFVLLSNIGEI
jgi:hypothetical protein